MHFVVQWTIAPEHRDDALARFRKTAGAAPAGVTMLSRWHCVDMSFGFAIAEGSDAEAIGRWAHDWSDLLVLKVTPVIDDAGFARVIGGS